MLDRESTFANPQIVKLLQTRFVPVAIDQAYQRRQKDNEGRFYQKIANQGPRKVGRGTTQGLYAADANGGLIGFTNNRGADRVMRMLNGALTKHRPAKVASIAKGTPDARYNPQPPKGGLIVRVTSKVLGGYEKTDNEWRRIFQTSLGRDNLWIRADEHAALAKGQLPKSLLARLARFHLVDNTRGEPPMWRETEIKKLEGTIKAGQLRATVQLQSADKTIPPTAASTNWISWPKASSTVKAATPAMPPKASSPSPSPSPSPMAKTLRMLFPRRVRAAGCRGTFRNDRCKRGRAVSPKPPRL